MSVKIDPPKPSVVPPRPAAPASPPAATSSTAEVDAIARQTGRTSSFDAIPVQRAAVPSEGPGNASEGRHHGNGTPDDSIGRNRGRGTPDDSIGRNRGNGTPDDSIGSEDALPDRAPENFELPDGVLNTPTAVNAAILGAGTSLGWDSGVSVEPLLTLPASERRFAAAVVTSPAFRAMNSTDQARVLQVMMEGGPRAPRAMAQLISSSGGALLSQPDIAGTRLIDSLARMTTTEQGRLALGDCLRDIANPGRIRQGQAPTCTVSSMQYELAMQQPAEYARLVAGLAVDGSVTMRGGGILTTSAADSMRTAAAHGDGRSQTEAIFQSAAMEFANGKDNFDLDGQRSVRSDGSTYRGLYPDQIRTMVGQLFGVGYQTVEVQSDAQADQVIGEMLSMERPNRPVLFDLDMGDFNHLVALDGFDGNNVRFRDPYTGEVETMPFSEFRSQLVAVHYAPLTAEKPAQVMERLRAYRAMLQNNMA